LTPHQYGIHVCETVHDCFDPVLGFTPIRDVVLRVEVLGRKVYDKTCKGILCTDKFRVVEILTEPQKRAALETMIYVPSIRVHRTELWTCLWVYVFNLAVVECDEAASARLVRAAPQPTVLDSAFYDFCREGLLAPAQRLVEMRVVDPNANYDQAYRWSCAFEQPHVAAWLIGLGGVKYV
jgi:hypothetical protein